MLQAAGVELAGQIGLIDEQRVIGQRLEVLPPDRHQFDRIARRRRRYRRPSCWLRYDESAIRITKATRWGRPRHAVDTDVSGRVRNLQAVVEIMFEPGCRDVGIS